MKLEFSKQVFEKSQISNFMKVHPMGPELFHVYRQADIQTDVTKLTVAFRNFVNAPKNSKARDVPSSVIGTQSNEDISSFYETLKFNSLKKTPSAYETCLQPLQDITFFTHYCGTHSKTA
jgi:hypothetical protein